MQNITQTYLPGISTMAAGAALITLNGTAVGTLSPQEAALYPTLFRAALGPKMAQSCTSIPGTVGAKFLQRSGLSKKQLHDIWELADPGNSGFLTPDGFYRACRLVAHGQSGQQMMTSDLLGMEPESLPEFQGVSDLGSVSVWKISDSELARYREVFRKETGGGSKIDGSDARALLVKSGLSSSELCDIWDIADVDKDGKLTFGEFVAVMHLVSKLRDGSIGFIPSELPSGLKGFLSLPIDGVPIAPPPPAMVSDPLDELHPSDSVSPKHAACEPIYCPPDRSREFRRQVASDRSRLETLRLEARKVEQALISADHEVSLLQDQILGLKSYISEAEEELDEFRRFAADGDVVKAVSDVRESIAEDEREILELRAKLERTAREKTDLQSSLSVSCEKKRQAEQDRYLIMVALESDRAKLVSVRADRLKLWEQRSELTRELTTKTFDQMGGRAGGTIVSNDSSRSGSKSSVIRDRKGIKANEDLSSGWGNANSTFENSRPEWATPGLTSNLFTDKNIGTANPLAGAFSDSNSSVPHFGSSPM